MRGNMLSGKSVRIVVPVFIGTAAVFYVLGLSNLLSSNVMRYLLQIFLYIALGEAWNLLSGFAGMTSLGQQLYVGLAGYALTVMTSILRKNLVLGISAGAAAAVVVAFFLSLMLFRMRGMYFAIGTWVAAEAAEKVFLNWKFVGQGSGMTVRLSPYPNVGQIYLLALTVCLFSVALICLILRSKLGWALLAMRDDPSAAATIGVNLRQTRLFVYMIGALISSLAGSIFFLNKGTIYPDSGFSSGWTVSSVFICIIGGTGTITGPIAGSVIYVLLREILAHYPGWSNILLGLITLLVIFFLPDGVVGTIKKRFIKARTG